MRFLFRYIVLVIVLSFMSGCALLQPFDQTSEKPNAFAWPKPAWSKQKEPEGAQRTSMDRVLTQPRPTITR